MKYIRKYIRQLIIIFVGILFVILPYTTKKSSNISELYKINSRLSDYSFTKGCRGSKSYFIYMYGYNNKFQIPASIVSRFRQREFTENVKKGNFIDLYVNKKEIESVSKTIYVWGIENSNMVFLNKEKSIDTYNLDILIGIMFGIVGILTGTIWIIISKYKSSH